MAYINTTPPDQASGAVRELYERQQGKNGYVPNYAKVFCYRPELMGLWANLQAGIRRHVEPRRFELITFAAAQAMYNSYCSLAHGQALTRIFSADDVQAMTGAEEVESLTPAEREMMKFAGKVAVDAANITAEEVAALKENGFVDEEIFDIVITASARAFFSKISDGLGVEPDVAFMDMDEALRNALTVGRPISRGEPEKIE